MPLGTSRGTHCKRTSVQEELSGALGTAVSDCVRLNVQGNGGGGCHQGRGSGPVGTRGVRTCLGLYECPNRMLSVVFLWPLTSDLFRLRCVTCSLLTGGGGGSR